MIRAGVVTERLSPAAKPSRPVAAPIERLIITGAGGWLGRTALDLACRWWGESAPERIVAYGSRAAQVEIGGYPFSLRPLDALPGEDLSGAVVLHLAFLTKERVGQLRDQDYISGNLHIDETVIDACRRSSPAGIFVASSGAARLAQQGPGEMYGLLKLVQEQRFTELRTALAVPVLIGRIWSLAGPYINKPDAYALSAFLLQARLERRITIKAERPVYRSYLHAQDLIEVAIATLAAPDRTPLEVIDLAGSEVVEMSDIAFAAARAAGLSEDTVHRGTLAFDSRSVYVGDPTPFRDLALALALRPRSFAQQVEDTLTYLDATAQQNGGETVGG